MKDMLIKMIEEFTGKNKKGYIFDVIDAHGRSYSQVVMLIQTVGVAIKEDEENKACVFGVKTGFANMATAYLAICMKDSQIEIIANAQEGLIKQNLAKKVVDKIRRIINEK